MLAVVSYLGEVAPHGLTRSLRRTVLDGSEDAFVMALAALSAAVCSEDAAAVLVQDVDDG
jgi:hypothetical protein